MPSRRRALAVGAVSKTYTSYSFLNIRSTMFSNMADSSKAGFMVALSTNESAWVEISANFRNQRIFCLMSCFDRSMVSLVSISYAQRFGTPVTAVGVLLTSWLSSPLRLCTGLVDARMVRRPACAIWMAVTPAITVFPTPPLPPKNKNFSLGRASMNSVNDSLISGMSVTPVGVHQSRQLFDHGQPGDVAFHLRHTRDHLAAKCVVNLFQIAALHLQPVLEVRWDGPARQIRRQHAVDDIAGDGHVEFGEQLGRFLGIENDHLLRYHDEEERGLLFVGQNAGRLINAILDVVELGENVIFFGGLLPLDARHQLLVLAHFFAQLGDPVDPLVIHLGHGEVVQGVAERHEVIDVVVVITADYDIHDRVEDRRLFHRRLRRRRLDVVLDFFRHLLHAVHVNDLLPNLVLVGADMAVRVNFLGVQVVNDLDRALAVDILLEDVVV